MPGSVAALRDMRCMPTKSSLPPPAPRIGHSNIFKTSDSRHAAMSAVSATHHLDTAQLNIYFREN